MLERTLEREREDLRKEKDDNRKEKLRRQKFEKQVLDLMQRVQQVIHLLSLGPKQLCFPAI